MTKPQQSAAPPPTIEHRVTLLRSATLLHSLAEEMLLHEPCEAELVARERELLMRARQLVSVLEGRYRHKPAAAERGVIDLERRARLRAVSAALEAPPPGPRSPPRRAA